MNGKKAIKEGEETSSKTDVTNQEGVHFANDFCLTIVDDLKNGTTPVPPPS